MAGGLRSVHFLRLLQPAHQSSRSAGPLLLQVHPLAGADPGLVAGVADVELVTGAVVVAGVAVAIVVETEVVVAPAVSAKFGASCLAATLYPLNLGS